MTMIKYRKTEKIIDQFRQLREGLEKHQAELSILFKENRNPLEQYEKIITQLETKKANLLAEQEKYQAVFKDFAASYEKARRTLKSDIKKIKNAIKKDSTKLHDFGISPEVNEFHTIKPFPKSSFQISYQRKNFLNNTKSNQL